MTAGALLEDLQARGVRIWVEGEKLKLDAPAGCLTEADRTALAGAKPELIAMLSRPRLGSIRRPMPVRGSKMPAECLFDGCDGKLSSRDNLYYCGICNCYFELV